MCGIAGYLGPEAPDAAVLKRMTDRIAHRGPDGEGFCLNGHCALGHRRLAILDLKTGDQPIYNEDRSVATVYNGEIYNYQELRAELREAGHVFTTQTDTEVLVHGWETWGEELPKHLRGMFAFAIWDTRTQALFLARDGWGIKPLYYAQMNGVFLFASEIKAFLDHPAFRKELNENLLQAYLCFNSNPSDETFFKGVFRLPPGHQLLVRDGRIALSRYFTLTFTEDGAYDKAAVDDIERVMKDSVAHHMHADVEVGSLLSSGVDSSYLVSLGRPAKTFTVGYDDPRYDEISYAKDLTERLGIANISRIITKEEYIRNFPNILYHFDEPLADPAAIALYFVTEIAAKRVKVVMSGEGADELFGGYNSYHEETNNAYGILPFGLRHAVSEIAAALPEGRGLNYLYRKGQKLEDYHIGLGRVFRDSDALKLCRNKDQRSPVSFTKPFYEAYKNNSTMVQRQVIDVYFWLINDFLHAADRNAMMFGLEVRTPYLDNKVFEVARRLPKEAKVSAGETKIALRAAASRSIPNGAYAKKKLGFPVPLREWVREDDLYADIAKAFASPAAAAFFDVPAIQRLLEDHRSGRRDTYKKVWTIYTFLVWYDVFFESGRSRGFRS